MELTGEQRINATRSRVWAALNDVDVLRASLPGCEALEKEGDDAFKATVRASVGPVKAKFNGEVHLENIDAPNGYTLVGEGKGGAAGFAKGQADVRLEDEGDTTKLSYTVKANVGGQLARIGGRLIDATAKKLSDEFFTNFRAQVEGVEEAPKPEAEVEAVSVEAEAAPRRGLSPIIWGGALILAVLLFLWYVAA